MSEFERRFMREGKREQRQRERQPAITRLCNGEGQLPFLRLDRATARAGSPMVAWSRDADLSEMRQPSSNLSSEVEMKHPHADRLKLRKPCLHCPFSRHPERIRFACRERAEEVEEIAYREGFPCHESATWEGDDEEEFTAFGPTTQHCAGSVFLRINEGMETEWPALDNEELPQSYIDRVLPFLGEAWDDTEEFFAANEAEGD